MNVAYNNISEPLWRGRDAQQQEDEHHRNVHRPQEEGPASVWREYSEAFPNLIWSSLPFHLFYIFVLYVILGFNDSCCCKNTCYLCLPRPLFSGRFYVVLSGRGRRAEKKDLALQEEDQASEIDDSWSMLCTAECPSKKKVGPSQGQFPWETPQPCSIK